MFSVDMTFEVKFVFLADYNNVAQPDYSKVEGAVVISIVTQL